LTRRIFSARRGYRFREIDVGKDRQAYEEKKQLSAQTYVPTFVAGDRVLANFDTDQLEKFLNEHQIDP
jgi:glutaredoxin